MAKQKYDWIALEIEYMKSEKIDVSDFFKSKFGISTVDNGGMRKNTVGWKEKKLAYREEAKAKAHESIVEEMAELYKPTVKELNSMHKGLTQLFQAKIYSDNQKIVRLEDGTLIIPPDLDFGVYERIWNIVKTEKGEQTRITEERFGTPDGEPVDVVKFYLPSNGRIKGQENVQ